MGRLTLRGALRAGLQLHARADGAGGGGVPRAGEPAEDRRPLAAARAVQVTPYLSPEITPNERLN